jgi:hypothetical protein
MIKNALESSLVACAVQADVSTVESGSYFFEFGLEGAEALT